MVSVYVEPGSKLIYRKDRNTYVKNVVREL